MIVRWRPTNPYPPETFAWSSFELGAAGRRTLLLLLRAVGIFRLTRWLGRVVG